MINPSAHALRRGLAAAIILAAALASIHCGSSGPAGGAEIYEASPQFALDGTQGQLLSVDFGKIRALGFYERAKAGLLEDKERSAWWNDLTGALGFNPLEKVERTLVGFHGDYNLDDPFSNAVFVCVGNFDDPEKLVGAARKFAGQRYLVDPPEFVSVKLHGAKVWSMIGAKSKADPAKKIDCVFAFPSPRLMVFARKQEYVSKTLEVIGGKAQGLGANDAWKARLTRVDFGAAIWVAGDIPASVNKLIHDHVQTDPDLKGLIQLDAGKSFTFRLGGDGREYRAELSVTADEIFRANGMKDQFVTARDRGVMKRVVAYYLGQASPAVETWQTQVFAKASVLALERTTQVVIRLDRDAAAKFVEDLIRPAAAPAAGPGAPTIWNK